MDNHLIKSKFAYNICVQVASRFAQKAHQGQSRKYTLVPYFTHCAEVARIVELAGGDADMVAAAYLHDTIEDCGVTEQELAHEVGVHAASLVYWLTDASKPSDGNRAARKAIDRAHIASAPDRAKIIKLADLISNTLSISVWDSSFARVYLAEKRLLLPLIRDADHYLAKVADQAIDFAESVLITEAMADALRR